MQENGWQMMAGSNIAWPLEGILKWLIYVDFRNNMATNKPKGLYVLLGASA